MLLEFPKPLGDFPRPPRIPGIRIRPGLTCERCPCQIEPRFCVKRRQLVPATPAKASDRGDRTGAPSAFLTAVQILRMLVTGHCESLSE